MSQIYGKTFSRGSLSPSHKMIVNIVGMNKQVLELGSSNGYLTQEFNKNKCNVTIVELDKSDFKKAQKISAKGYQGSLDDSSFLKNINGKYDVVVAADIIEHLKDTQKTLEFIKSKLNKKGRCIISLPNIACWRIRKDLFFKGTFEYQEMGILDKTHLKFFTYFTIQKILKENGFKIINLYKEDIHYPFKWSLLKLPILGKLIDSAFTTFFVSKYPNVAVGHMILEVNQK